MNFKQAIAAVALCAAASAASAVTLQVDYAGAGTPDTFSGSLFALAGTTFDNVLLDGSTAGIVFSAPANTYYFFSTSSNLTSHLVSFDLLNGGDYSRSFVYYEGSVGTAATVTPVPEPETYAMMLAGLGALGFMARRRQAK